MALYQDECVTIFFGDAKTAFDPAIARGKKVTECGELQLFSEVEQAFGKKPDELFFLHQTHGIQGAIITEENKNFPLFSQDGDFLTTGRVNCALGVATADCLPIVFFDVQTKVVSVVHAGWRGLVAGVVEQALRSMRSVYLSNAADIQCIIGPAAQVCCYEVGKDFFEQALAVRSDRAPFLEQSLAEKNGKCYFNSLAFLRMIFREQELVEKNCNYSYAQCTICNLTYCSYRRDKKSSLRQFTIVSLK